MFGGEMRRRVEALEQAVKEAAAVGAKASLEIATHSGVCTEQNTNRKIWEGEIKDALKSLFRANTRMLWAILAVLATMVGTILLQLAIARHIFG